MAHGTHVGRDLSARRIVGFACSQAFVFFLFYAGTNYAFDTEQLQFERIDLFIMLAFMAAGFAAARILPGAAREMLLSHPSLYVCAVSMAVGSLAPSVLGPNAVGFLAEGVLVGFPSALLLMAWGRTFGHVPMAVSVSEVFVGSLVAALVCILISLVPAENPVLHMFRLLPLAGVVNIEMPDDSAARLFLTEVESDEERALSYKILAGTLLFGLAGGLMVPLATFPVGPAAPHYPTSMLLFGAFLVGGLTLQLSDEPGRGMALNRSYRLAVFIMMAGVLVVAWPPFEQSIMPGESIVLAGYLGLEAVLIALFLVLADITAQDAAFSFSRGFSVLFAGEASGIALANALGPVAEFAIPGIAGLLVLLSYVFLFTEQDFDALSRIVTRSDSFEHVCAAIAERYRLSNRESEILAFALRGRSSERIAQELVIAKSTVDTHLRRIYAKCGVHSRQELLDLAER